MWPVHLFATATSCWGQEAFSSLEVTFWKCCRMVSIWKAQMSNQILLCSSFHSTDTLWLAIGYVVFSCFRVFFYRYGPSFFCLSLHTVSSETSFKKTVQVQMPCFVSTSQKCFCCHLMIPNAKNNFLRKGRAVTCSWARVKSWSASSSTRWYIRKNEKHWQDSRRTRLKGVVNITWPVVSKRKTIWIKYA